jgi:hypothetical protein
MRQGLAVNPTASLLPCQDHPRLQGRDPATDAHEDLWLTASSLAVQPITSDPFPNPGRCVADVALKLQRQRSMLFQDGDPKMVEWHREIWRPERDPAEQLIPAPAAICHGQQHHCEATLLVRDCAETMATPPRNLAPYAQQPAIPHVVMATRATILQPCFDMPKRKGRLQFWLQDG